MPADKRVILTDAMSKKLAYFSQKWDVSEAEAMRRLFGMGSFIAEELANGRELYSEDSNTHERVVWRPYD